MLNDMKVVVYPSKVILYNYLSIIEISDNRIVIDKWIIEGEKLKICELDSYYLMIKGLIRGVIFVQENV